MSDALASAARLIAEPARADMLLQLMGGRAVPAGELALAAHITPQTASEHLGRLTEAGFVQATPHGRHRYYELANEEVAHAVESLLVLSSAPHQALSVLGAAHQLGTLRYARTCYAHLAGWLGVAITDALQREGYLVPAPGKSFVLTPRGTEWLAQHGIPSPLRTGVIDLKLARQCPDWTERRPHLAGTLGVNLYRRLTALRWIAPSPKSRAVRITLEGRQSLQKHLNIVVG